MRQPQGAATHRVLMDLTTRIPTLRTHDSARSVLAEAMVDHWGR